MAKKKLRKLSNREKVAKKLLTKNQNRKIRSDQKKSK